MSRETRGRDPSARLRLQIAFFEFPDVFEDFYPKYGVSQLEFATLWANTGSHDFVARLQRIVGDVTWNEFSLFPELEEAHHEVAGCTVRFHRSSAFHRLLWATFYGRSWSWRLRRWYPYYAAVASFFAPAALRFIPLARKSPPDIMFLQDYSSAKFEALLLLSRLIHRPLVAYHAGSTPDQYFNRRVKRYTIRRADQIIVSSKNEAEMLIHEFGVPADRVSVILTPVDLDKFVPVDRQDACASLGLDPKRRYLLFMGRLEELKNVALLMRVFVSLASEHPDVDLLIVGDGTDAENLRRLESELASDQIRLLGWRGSVEDRRHLYNAAECLVLPSLREGFPTVVGESMACGTPVLASRVGGVAELVVEGISGWMVEPGDWGELRSKLNVILSDRTSVRSMRGTARRIASERLDRSKIDAQLKLVFMDHRE